MKKYNFFEHLIMHTTLNENDMVKIIDRSGRQHAAYSKYGMKPHFMDIFQQQFVGILAKITPKETNNHEAMIQGFTILLSFVIDRMNYAYNETVKEIRAKETKEI